VSKGDPIEPGPVSKASGIVTNADKIVADADAATQAYSDAEAC
jgi:hypothetical protein